VKLARTTTSLLAVLLLATGCGADDPEPEPEPLPLEDPEPVEEPEPGEPEPAGRAPLTGMPLDEDGVALLAERPALLVKVANSPSARPQAGLDEADVVFEETVEGGVTRFMAVFHSQLPDQIGPVRSGRLVDADLGGGYSSPVFAYSGGRAEVQSRLRAAPMIVLEEGAPGFVRTSDRRRPDNLFLVPETTVQAGADRGALPLEDAGWVFDDEAPDGEVTCPSDATDCDDPGAGITVAMSAAARTGWTYDESEGRYRREQNGTASTVVGDGRIGAANVIVLATRHYSPGCCDSAGSPYVESDVIGGDRGLVLRDGRRYEVRWDKPSADAPLRVLTEDGEPFPLAPGPSWVLLPSTERFPG
jgi:hypothetical protein